METSPAKPQNMIDTTDALEAVSACQSMKNFLFTLILIGLVLCQTVFWMNRFGLVKKDGCPAHKAACPAAAPKAPPLPNACLKSKPQASTQHTGLVFLAATTLPEEPAEPAAEKAEPAPIEQAIDEIVKTANQPTSEKEIQLEDNTGPVPATTPADGPPVPAAEAGTEAAQEPAPAAEKIPAKKDLFGVSCKFAVVLVTVCNFIILAAAILYCLSLLICLKISLTGRLGGINHITRAFFISLFLLVVLVPWQRVLPGVMVGAIWLPRELLCGGWAGADTSISWKVVLYLRFSGLCLAAVGLLLWAQIRSAKWARAILRRLGVIR